MGKKETNEEGDPINVVIFVFTEEFLGSYVLDHPEDFLKDERIHEMTKAS